MTDTYLVRPGCGMPHSAARWIAGCRCLFCTAAYQAEPRRRAPRPQSTAPHGTVGRASGGCRCVPCHNVRRTAVA